MEYAMEDKVLIAAEHHRYSQAFRPLAPQIACSASRREVTIFYMLLLLQAGFLYSPKIDAFQVPEYHGRLHLVTPRFITAAHRKNIRVHVWTINDEEDMHRLLCWGADGIITDFPDRLSRVLQEHSGNMHQRTSERR
jgi:glycerophosphoryl diester phosphodiesterase